MDFKILSRPSYSLLELNLEDGEEIQAETGAMVYMKNIKLKTEMKGGILGSLKRALLGGESFFINRFVSIGNGLLGLAPSYNGDITHISLSNETIYAQSGAFLACSPEIEIDWKWGGARMFFAGEGLILLKLYGSGSLFLSSFGGLEKIELKDERVMIDTGHVVAFTDGLHYTIRRAGNLKATLLSGEGLVVEFSGTGTVWVQTRSIAAYLGWLSSLLPRILKEGKS